MEGLTRFYRRALLRAAATRLAGRPVDIEWRPPDAPYQKGAARRAGNTGIVVIDPDLEGQDLFDVYLHELAHVRLHFETIPDDLARPLVAAKADPRGSTAWSRAAYARREQDAAELACQWAEQVRLLLPGGRGSVEDCAIAVLGLPRQA